MQRFISQDGTTVVADDYKGINTKWTLDLKQTFTDHWFVYGYELQKSVWRHKTNKKVVVIPYSLLKAVESGKVFRKENLVAGDAEFYHIPEGDYFIRKYDARIAQKIADGLLTVDNSCIIGSKCIYYI